MTNETAEIIRFEWDHKKSNDIFTHRDLQRRFKKDFDKIYNPDYKMETASLLKVSDSWTESNDIHFMFYPIPLTGEEIHKIDDVRFIGDALRAVKQYRVIDDKLYKFIDNGKDYGVGQHIFAANNKPLFNIDILETNYAYKTFYINSRKTKNSFQYIPNLDAKPRYVELELVTKDPNEDIITNMFKDVKLHYIDRGLKVIENETFD